MPDAGQPEYGAYDRRSTTDRVKARREERKLGQRDPQREVAELKQQLAAAIQRIAVLEQFNAGLTGDGTGIEVSGNVLKLNKTWQITGTHTCVDGQSIFDFTVK